MGISGIWIGKIILEWLLMFFYAFKIRFTDWEENAGEAKQILIDDKYKMKEYRKSLKRD